MATFKLVTYATSEGPKAGMICDGRTFDVATVTRQKHYGSVMGILADWRKAKPILKKAAAATVKSARGEVRKAKLLAPIPLPGTIYCAGANYRDHVLEMSRAQNITPEPDPHSVGLKAWHFIKPGGCVTGPGKVVKLPKHSQKVDWEAELVAVIGRTAKDVPLERALDYVAGYTIANDLSARDLSKRPPVSDTSPFKFDWVGQKCFDEACPLGPWIVLAEDVGDPQDLKIDLSINGVSKQDSHTSQMIFTTAEQIAHISARITLHPGDLILTGTPAGVGMPRPEFLKPGDEVRITIERVGELVNRFS